MRLAFGEGLILAVLAPIVLVLVGALTLSLGVSLIFLLTGAWTVVSAFAFAQQRERIFSLTWGLIVASFSSFLILKLQYAVAVVVLVVIASILLNVATRKDRPRVQAVQNSSDRATSTV